MGVVNELVSLTVDCRTVGQIGGGVNTLVPWFVPHTPSRTSFYLKLYNEKNAVPNTTEEAMSGLVRHLCGMPVPAL